MRIADIQVEHTTNRWGRRICNVIIDYRHLNTNVVEQFYVPVDVTGKWPFMTQTIQSYYGIR
jgi:hypothetical protein